MNKYYQAKKQEIISKLKKDAVNYIFISDIHYMGIKTGQGAVLLEQMKQVCSLANECDNIDLLVLGGDTVQGYWQDKRDCFKAYREIFAALKECKKPVLIVNGNHDDNAYAEWNPNYSQKIISELDWKREVLDPFAVKDRVHPKDDENSKHYYYDLKKDGKTTRVFCLDAADNKMEYDKDTGVVTKLYLVDGKTEDTPEGSYKYYTGMSRWGYSKEQIKWFAEALMMGGFDNAIIFSHSTTEEDFGEELGAVIMAYNNKTEYRNDELGIDVNYTDSGKILIYHYGHIHREHKVYREDLSLWQIASSTARADQASPEDDRTAGTEKEPCFDIVSVKSTGFVKYNIGGGTDQESNC